MKDCNEVHVGMPVKVGQLRHSESEMTYTDYRNS
jgi:hypothetical protein